MSCPNPHYAGPSWRDNIGSRVCVLQQTWVATHSGQTAPQLKPRYLSQESLAKRARADQEAHGIFITPTPEPPAPKKSSDPDLKSRGDSPAKEGDVQQASVGIVEALWRAAGSFIEAVNPAPGPSLPVADPAPAQATEPGAVRQAPVSELSPERLQRRKALALLKTHGGLNGAQARELLEAYTVAGIPINEHTVSHYHAWNIVQEPEVLVQIGGKRIFKTDFMVDGQRQTRVVKYKPCHRTEARAQASHPADLEKPFPGGRHCEMHVLSASAISKYLDWNVVPDCWLGSFKTGDGKLHLALVMEYLPGEEVGAGTHRGEPLFRLKMERIAMLSSLVGERDNAAAIAVKKQLNGKTVHDPYIADFEFAFDLDVSVSPAPQEGFPDAGFGAPEALSRSTRDGLLGLVSSGTLHKLLAPFQLDAAIRAVEKRGALLNAYCARLDQEGKIT